MHDINRFLTCPILALALALMIQQGPCAALLSHLPTSAARVDSDAVATVPLVELLEDVAISVAEPRLAVRMSIELDRKNH